MKNDELLTFLDVYTASRSETVKSIYEQIKADCKTYKDVHEAIDSLKQHYWYSERLRNICDELSTELEKLLVDEERGLPIA